MRFFAAQAELEQSLFHEFKNAAVISEVYPLRCNLTGAENVALVRQYHRRETRAKSLAAAGKSLEQGGHAAAAGKRDGDMSEEERFAVKLVRSLMLERPVLVVDRPAAMLPNRDYAPLVFALLGRFSERSAPAVVLDYEWNRLLYRDLLP